MEQQNTGSFGAAIGGSPELIEAMQRRGMDVSALQQGSATSAVPSPVAPAPDMASAQAALPQQAPAEPQAPDSDVTIAMKALSTVVTNDSKLKRDLVNLRAQGAV